jgi:hypothetical protein
MALPGRVGGYLGSCLRPAKILIRSGKSHYCLPKRLMDSGMNSVLFVPAGEGV